MATKKNNISVEVAYAGVDKQRVITVSLPAKATILDAIQASHIVKEFSEIDLEQVAVGIFGKLIADWRTKILQPGDRVEIYRPLRMDPKELRKLKAKNHRS